ncbi:MAG: hypothetical protein O7F73_11570 [Gammaproteobacteria bacterium]|nr:hypothetical protein [Gammaproteobacteria bacterium]
MSSTPALTDASLELDNRVATLTFNRDDVRMSKRLLKAAQRMELKDLLDMSASMQAISHQMSDHIEAVNAFLDKRKPEFSGD